MGIISVPKKILAGIYKQIFKNKIRVKELEKEQASLRYQLEYLKHHFDISEMKPATGWLREYQLAELDFALEIIDVVNSEGISPFFDAGSLLGAVRHKGFIPFDDDIDLGVIREDFDKLIKLAKEKYTWIDTSDFNGNFEAFCDEMISANSGKYVFIRTPFCLHVYKGTCLRDAVNCEFFPFDYVNDNLSENDFISFVSGFKNQFSLSNTWGEIFDSYDLLLSNKDIFLQGKSSKIVAGPGHYAFTEYRFWGFRNTDDLFPLTTLTFEGKNVPVPSNPVNFVSKNYSSWKDFPSDVGISHTLAVINDYLKTKNKSIPYKENF